MLKSPRRRAESAARPRVEATGSSPVRSHELQVLQNAVFRLETQHQEQLELERENQAVFDFVKAELGRITQSISNLSTTVESELRSLKLEVESATEASKAAKQLATEATGTASRASSTSQHMENEQQAVRRAVAALDEELRERKREFAELLGTHSSAAARVDQDFGQRCKRIEEELGTVTARFSERLTGNETRCGSLASVVEKVEEWSNEAKPLLRRLEKEQLASTTQLREDEASAYDMRNWQVDLSGRLGDVSGQVSQHGGELSRHREAVVLMVDTIDSLGRDQQTLTATVTPRLEEISREQTALAARFDAWMEAAEQRSRRQAKEIAGLTSDVAALRDAFRALQRAHISESGAIGANGQATAASWIHLPPHAQRAV